MFDTLSTALISLVVGAINLLPASPFRPIIDSMRDSALLDVFGYLNWLLPLSAFAKVFIAWIAGISIYMIYQMLLRWAKVIQ